MKQLNFSANKELLQDPSTYASIIILLVGDMLGVEGFEYDPTVICRQLEKRYGIEIPQITADKIAVGIVMLTTDRFHTDPKTFIDCCNVMCGTELDPTVFDPASVAECSWGITESLFLSPPDEAVVFSEDIRRYVDAILKEEGFTRPPNILKSVLGTYEADLSSQFVDDPAMFQAVYETQLSKTADLEDRIRQSIVELQRQLSAVSLLNGSTEGILQKIKKVLSD